METRTEEIYKCEECNNILYSKAEMREHEEDEGHFSFECMLIDEEEPKFTLGEIEDVLDFTNTHPLWLLVKNNETGKVEQIPEAIQPMLEDFLTAMNKVVIRLLKEKGEDRKK